VNKKLIISVLILGLVSLFLENLLPGDPRFSLPINIIDFTIIFLSWLELAMDLRKAAYRGIYIPGKTWSPFCFSSALPFCSE